ncbi:MAG: PIN domain-containing protein [Pseudomonadota bacterium]|nr:PIN domain-containing protein [Pseudomonadota bacterium]
MRHLCDSNVFVALTVNVHPALEAARGWLQTLLAGDTLGFCRMSEMSFLRLLTQRIAEGYAPVKNKEAVRKLEQWKRLAFVERCNEPEGMEEDWLRMAGVGQAAPKRWMDAYLAAFALHAGMRFVTLDGDFEKYKEAGIDVLMLRAPNKEGA